jgi:hypothetical protein
MHFTMEISCFVHLHFRAISVKSLKLEHCVFFGLFNIKSEVAQSVTCNYLLSIASAKWEIPKNHFYFLFHICLVESAKVIGL